MKKERVSTIDLMRGVATISMIIIHVLAYFGDFYSKFIWNALQFAVPLFIVCSSAVIVHKKEINFKFSTIISRLYRLFVPYIYYLLLFYWPFIFLVNKKKFTFDFVFSAFTFTNPDMSWIILLFSYFTILTPFLVFLYRFHKKIFIYYGIFSFIFTLLLFFNVPKINYRLFMWLPWSFVTVATIYFNNENKLSKRIFTIIFFTLIYISLYLYAYFHNMNLMHYNHKYPPDIFHLSYGLAISFILWIFIEKFFHLNEKIKENNMSKVIEFLKKQNIFTIIFWYIIKWFGVHSYELYFIHFIAIYLVSYFGLYHKKPAIFFCAIVFIFSFLFEMIRQKVILPISGNLISIFFKRNKKK